MRVGDESKWPKKPLVVNVRTLSNINNENLDNKNKARVVHCWREYSATSKKFKYNSTYSKIILGYKNSFRYIQIQKSSKFMHMCLNTN